MRHIPNILSFSRILLIPPIVYFLLQSNLVAAAVLIIISGLTDLLDGFLARRFNWISQLGKVLDPIADKLTQAAVCVTLFIIMREYWPFFGALLFKDFVMLVLGGYLIGKGVKIEGAKWFGKVVTCLFYISITTILIFPNIPGWIKTTLLALTTVCALIAALLYIPEFIKYKNSSDTNS